MDPRFVVAVLVALSPASASADRIVRVVRDGVDLRPGADDAREGTSSIAKHAMEFPRWETTDETWHETIACLERVYAPFAVTFTEDDPGDVPHIAAVFGGSPLHLGLPRGYAGISPFTGDCSIIESSMVFTFTDILPPDAATACRVMAQEIGHSYGLDHQLRPGDPMSVQAFDGERVFVDEDVACGETSARPCGLPGSTCRASQNSYALLAERLAPPAPEVGGCSTSSSTGWLSLLVIALAGSLTRAGTLRSRRT